MSQVGKDREISKLSPEVCGRAPVTRKIELHSISVCGIQFLNTSLICAGTVYLELGAPEVYL